MPAVKRFAESSTMNFVINPEAQIQPPFSALIGMKVTHVSPDKVIAELPVREELNNRFGALHGGAVMALADNLGGTATIANLPKGGRTATIESKTNFFASVPVGDVARAECTPLHRGRSTTVWQTRITRGDGRLCALVIQTQIVFAPPSRLRPANRLKSPPSSSTDRAPAKCWSKSKRPGSVTPMNSPCPAPIRKGYSRPFSATRARVSSWKPAPK